LFNGPTDVGVNLHFNASAKHCYPPFSNRQRFEIDDRLEDKKKDYWNRTAITVSLHMHAHGGQFLQFWA